ncbi:MAG: beta-lactamase family protein [Fimbriimonadaceae bacterium]|nr:beta-lactamase family protein [Fimbriimonadaceae bacterium]
MSLVTEILERGVRERGFPGATYAYGRGAQVTYGAVGRETFDEDSPLVTLDTVYDLASLTKVLATTPLALFAVRSGALALDTKIGDILPEAGVGDATVWHLLTHSSGLPPYDHPLAQSGLGTAETRRRVVATKPESDLGATTAYSCLGFIILGAVLEHVLDDRLDVLFKRHVAGPTGHRTLTYLPAVRTAPTDPGLVPGVVHDPLARALGGVSGNAGLFGTVADVVRSAQAWLDMDAEGRAWTVRQSDRSTRALGWDTKSEEGSSAGTLFGPQSFGHTGYTGTSVWIDPADGTFVVLLTNRVYPDDTSTAMQTVRPHVADAAKLALRRDS